MNPNQEEQNPYLQALAQARGQQGGQPQGGMGMMGGDQGGMAPGMGMAQSMMQGGQGQQGGMSMMQPTQPPSTTKGQTGDNTKALAQALNAIHSYISQATDRADIIMGRNIVALLSQLILKDQRKAQQTDEQLDQQMQGGQLPIQQQTPQSVSGQ